MRERERRGTALGIGAYLIWGGFPLYFPLLEPTPAVEILAYRVLFSCLTMGVAVVALRRVEALRAVLHDRRRLTLLAGAAAVISVNWGVYIYGVTSARVVETSLGYFVNPLVTVLMGVVVLGERLRRGQWVALAVAALAVGVLTLDYGRPPWVALVLAFSFGTYGLLKKQAGVDAVESLTLETLILVPLAVAYLAFTASTGSLSLVADGGGHAALLASSGLVTAIPLLMFGAAAVRVPMVTLGLLQYLAPILQFALGVLWFHEDMPAGRWAGFALVWVALVLFTAESLQHRHRQLRTVALGSTAA